MRRCILPLTGRLIEQAKLIFAAGRYDVFILAFFNVFLGIFFIVLISKLWEKLEGWFYVRFNDKLNKYTLFLFMTLVISLILYSAILTIEFIFHYSFINIMFVASFILMAINFFSPYYSSHMLNEERVFMKYAIKISSDTPVTIFSITVTPFLLASLGIFLVTAILTVKSYWHHFNCKLTFTF